MKLTIVLHIICALSFFAQQNSGWQKINSPTNDFLRKIFFIDENTGWAAGLSGTIIATTDGGSNWQIQNTGITSPVVDIFFIDKNTGWALSQSSQIPFGTAVLKTTNGGLNWNTNLFFFEDENMSSIHFFNDNDGLVCGKTIRKTTDGGLSWNDSEIEPGGVSTFPVIEFNFYNDSLGYACGGRRDIAGVIWRTTNGGNNWSSTGISPDEIFDIFIFDSLNAIALSGDPEGFFGIGFIKTTDAGMNWNFIELPIFGMSYSLDFINDTSGWSASGFQFVFTNDKGKNWFTESTPDNAVIYDLQFVNSSTGFACGENGTILKYSNTSPIDDDDFITTEFKLEQNYPNPFNPSTKLRYSIPTSPQSPPSQGEEVGVVTLKVYDILGKEIATLVNEVQSAGNYEVNFSAASGGADATGNLASGIYFYQLRIGYPSANTVRGFIESKKMTFIK